jgi:DNA-binding winged helix-turn-helix (wHTH) protein
VDTDQEIAGEMTVVFEIGREMCTCAVVSSTRGGHIMVERRSLTFGPYRLDLLHSRLRRQAQPIALRPQALTMLRYLVLHADRLVTKAELFQHVWDGRQVTDTVLRGCIHAIRTALADSAATPQYLETVGRQGYRFRLGRAAPRLGSADTRPVVGRQREVEWLRECWVWALAGRRQFGVLSGEAGIGKTTGVDHFVASLAPQQEVGVGRGQCIDTYGDGEPYLPMLEALGQLGQSPHREALLAVLQRYAPTWLVHLPALLGEGERERLQRQLQGVTPARMLRALAEALEVLTTTIPLVLEDLHWSDVATVNLLTYLAQLDTQGFPERGAQPAGRPAAADHQTARDARPGRPAPSGSGQCGGRRVCNGSGGGGAGHGRGRCR